MNTKAQSTIIYVFMIGILFFFMGLALSPAINQVVGESRGTHYGGYVYNTEKSNWEINESAQVNCEDTTLSNQDKAVCTSEDMFNPLWIGIIFGLGSMVIVGVAVRG